MKIPKQTGKLENLAAFVAWIGLLCLYYFAGLQCVNGFFIYFLHKKRILEIFEMNPLGFFIIVASIIIALLTVRILFQLVLRWRAYHVRTGPGWSAWLSEKASTPEQNSQQDGQVKDDM